MTIREIGPGEACRLFDCLEALAEHHNRVSVHFQGLYPKTSSERKIREFEKDMEEGRSFIAVTEDQGQITGFCKISADGGLGVLEYLILLEEERGKGHGADFMNWALGRFRELGVKDVEVKVVYGNEAVRFYEKYGFRPCSVLLRSSL